MSRTSILLLFFWAWAGQVQLTWAAGQMSIKATNLVCRQGQTVEVYLERPSDQELALSPPELKFNGQHFRFFSGQQDPGQKFQQWCALLPIACNTPSGIYPVECNGDELNLKVMSAHFPVQRISLPKGKDTFAESPGEKDSIDHAKAAVSEHRYWHKQFSAPVSARLSSIFGVRRIVNGKLLPEYFHSGLDFAGYLGQPIKPCAPGKVILVNERFKLHGKTIAIDHGQGVISLYIHLNKIFVHIGQLVTNEQIIGQIGQTGRANGPHLHFSLYVNQVAVNPVDWFNRLF